MSADPLPLRAGDEGDAVRDVQTRLDGLDLSSAADDPGCYGPATDAAVRGFQQARGLRVDGVCGHQTWSSLVEAGYALGDRFIYHRIPMLRGDDVAELQGRLGALGFDAGRVDAILGPDTAGALQDFQRNAGLTVDGICGPDSVAALDRLVARQSGPRSVAEVRELERLRHAPRDLAHRRVVIGHQGEAGVLAEAIARALRDVGAWVQVVNHPDESMHAKEANDVEADLYVGVAVRRSDDPARLCYYSARGWESYGGHRLADLLGTELGTVLDMVPIAVEGMRLPVLRETRMTAVQCDLVRPEAVTATTPALAAAVVTAVSGWARDPVD
jgi:N-acetylmuramoyl-L-alanine amidase